MLPFWQVFPSSLLQQERNLGFEELMALGMAEGRRGKETHSEVQLSNEVLCSAPGKSQGSAVGGQPWEILA